LELGIGAGLTVISTEVSTISICGGTPGCVSASSTSTETESHFGLAPLSFSLGGFLSPQVALLFRGTGTSFFLGDEQWLNGLYGIAVQYWPSDIVYLGAGTGFATFGTNFLASNRSSDSVTGFGFSARVGIAVASLTHHSLRFAYEALPCFYDRGRVIGNALTFEWQYF
jgi:hypothetical protein